MSYVIKHACSHLDAADEHISLDENRYIGDLIVEFRALKERNKGEALQCKLLFKKKLFREADEAITEPMFIKLIYIQVTCMSIVYICVYLHTEPL